MPLLRSLRAGTPPAYPHLDVIAPEPAPRTRSDHGTPSCRACPPPKIRIGPQGEDTDRRFDDGARCTMHDAVVPDPRPVVHVRVLPRPAHAPWPVARLWSRMALSAPGTARRAQSEISRVSLASWCMCMSRRVVVGLEQGARRLPCTQRLSIQTFADEHATGPDLTSGRTSVMSASWSTAALSDTGCERSRVF
ncbi:hypothetical protein POSPLADRAFT_1037106 [Postia placenta MAD-698-R-SB12]|uniref:Uncharacterized protein n=1 Tax=Postia placenta MAD-698-R-SB12 TaxID=670580 RepID=A0A1X6MLP0_9APHY|nr:hypothetical protein POSPLADRAFT_1037106 [Postia placenta MAD-698-R-SB12]OSX57290.1 hypothetical protein POSPLADRAFT_1037106 [Postia placenta MAD-698-R-SB12]